MRERGSEIQVYGESGAPGRLALPLCGLRRSEISSVVRSNRIIVRGLNGFTSTNLSSAEAWFGHGVAQPNIVGKYEEAACNWEGSGLRERESENQVYGESGGARCLTLPLCGL